MVIDDASSYRFHIGDLVNLRDWDDERNEWCVVREAGPMMVIDVNNGDGIARSRNLVTILGPRSERIEVYAAYLIKVS